jgi:hypothetical protein
LIVDGDVGLFSIDDSSFDNVAIRTDDPAFRNDDPGNNAPVAENDASNTDEDTAAVIDV